MNITRNGLYLICKCPNAASACRRYFLPTSTYESCRLLRIQRRSVTEVEEENDQSVKEDGQISSTLSEEDYIEETPRVHRKSKLPYQVETPQLELVTEENQHEMLAKVVTPLWQVPYEEQLEMKQKNCENILIQFAEKLANTRTPVQRGYRGLPCPLQHIVPSPITDEYRNKDDFGVRHGVSGDPKTVGLLIGSGATGKAICVPPDHLINTRDSHKKVAKLYQEFLHTSPLSPCINFDEGGHWRNLIVRSTIGDHVMASVVFHPQKLPAEAIDEQAEILRQFFEDGPGAEAELSSMYFQACPNTRCTHQQAPFRRLFGQSHLLENVGQYQFRISPDSFFQINTAAAEQLYSVVQRLLRPKPSTTLLDVCCGTGTMSILMSPFVRSAVGVEVVYDAIRDARFNAEHNGIKNVDFWPGKAEKKLPKLLKKLDLVGDIAAVVNPARGGLHDDVVETIRNCQQIQRLVYVSCKPEGIAMTNFVDLCKRESGKRNCGAPFVPRMAVPVDLFPHTYHSELLVLFERSKHG